MDVGQLHILVVDDVHDVTDSCVELLSLWGYDAVACYDGASALESARARRPDAVLLDLAMPRMDGFRFAGWFRQMPGCGSVPLIAVSGYSGTAYHARAREAGIRHYLLKPADPTPLKELLARMVEPAAAPDPLFGGTARCVPPDLPQSGRWAPSRVKCRPRSGSVVEARAGHEDTDRQLGSKC